jgi:DNA-binding beta-propeller fold protein YncE
VPVTTLALTSAPRHPAPSPVNTPEHVLSGSITVISPATNTVSTAISGGAGTSALNAAPLGMAFIKAPATP